MKLNLIINTLVLLILVVKGETWKNEMSRLNGYILEVNDGPQVPVVTETKTPMRYPRFPAQRMRTSRSKLEELSQKYFNPMMKIPELNYQYLSLTMSRFMTIALSILVVPFVILSLFGDTGDFIFAQFGCISGVFGFSIGMMIFGGLIPDALAITASIIIAIANSYSTLKLTKVREMPHVSILFFSFLLSNLIYQLFAGITNFSINPLYTGIGGAILMRLSLFFGYRFRNLTLFIIALKTFYLLIVVILALLIHFALPKGLKQVSGNDKQSEEQISRLQKYTQSISSFILTFPLVSFLSQIMYISGIFSTSPFDMFSFFNVPSQLHFNYYSTSILLSIWILLTVSIYLFRTKITNRDLYQPKFIKSLISDHWKVQEL
ncbi:putative transmembrane protein [Cryptosporidium felis]|nr:putative transmembrane protein [Cryptosporidium felis]